MYDDDQSVKEKANYAKQKGLSGIYIFSIDEDDVQGFCGSAYPLTRAAASLLLPKIAKTSKKGVTSATTQEEQRCISSRKDCKQKVKCIRLPSIQLSNVTEVCAKDVQCIQPSTIIECPIPQSVVDANKNLFSMNTTKSSVIFVGQGNDAGPTTSVKCGPGLVSPLLKKDVGGVYYTCSEYGFLGRSVQEYTCPAGSIFSAVYLKCVLGGK
jgi:hypothetical protein